MSILGQLKNINAGHAVRLYDRHPLVDDAADVRLRYLCTVALACAPDRAPSAVERKAFLALGDSLGLTATDAEEQFDERASVREDDIISLFGAIRERNQRWLYLADVSWMHLVDGALDAGELAVTQELATLFDIDASRLALLHRMLGAVRDRDPRALVRALPDWTGDPELQRHLPRVVRRCMSFVQMLGDRWVDHGDGTVTDVRTVLRWRRGPEFAPAAHPDLPGIASVRYAADLDAGDAIVLALAVCPCDEVARGDLLATLTTAAGPVDIRAKETARVMSLCVVPGDPVRPNTELVTLALPGGPAIMYISVADNGKPTHTDLERIVAAIERANAKAPPPGMSPWRLPSSAEFDNVTEEPERSRFIFGLMMSGCREFAGEIFRALEAQKVWCCTEVRAEIITLENVRLFNRDCPGEAVVLLCRQPLTAGGTE